MDDASVLPDDLRERLTQLAQHRCRNCVAHMVGADGVSRCKADSPRHIDKAGKAVWPIVEQGEDGCRRFEKSPEVIGEIHAAVAELENRNAAAKAAQAQAELDRQAELERQRIEDEQRKADEEDAARLEKEAQ